MFTQLTGGADMLQMRSLAIKSRPWYKSSIYDLIHNFKYLFSQLRLVFEQEFFYLLDEFFILRKRLEQTINYTSCNCQAHTDLHIWIYLLPTLCQLAKKTFEEGQTDN